MSYTPAAMIPIRDDAPSRSFPFVTWALIAANVGVFVYQTQLGPTLGRFFDVFGLVPARFHSSDEVVGRWLPVLTSMFLHGGLAHLLGNLLYLHVFGDGVEDRMGHGRFLGFYVSCGCVAALVHALFVPASRLPMVGASGAVAGVTGAYFVSFPRARVLTVAPIPFCMPTLRVRAVVFLLVWFVIQVAWGAASIGAKGAAAAGGVAWWAHVGGFLAGMVLGTLVVRRRR